jgi:hypothetical protein
MMQTQNMETLNSERGDTFCRALAAFLLMEKLNVYDIFHAAAMGTLHGTLEDLEMPWRKLAVDFLRRNGPAAYEYLAEYLSWLPIGEEVEPDVDDKEVEIETGGDVYLSVTGPVTIYTKPCYEEDGPSV